MKKIAFAVLVSIGSISCVSTPNQQQNADREPAADPNPARISFQTEFSEAKAVNIITAHRDHKNRKINKQTVLLKWARSNPAEVRKELQRLQAAGEVDVGRVELMSNGKAVKSAVVFSYDDAKFVLSQPSFTKDVPAIFGKQPTAKIASVIEAKFSTIEPKLNELANRIVDDQAYEGTNLAGQAYARLEVPDQLGRLIPNAVNASYLGLDKVNYDKVRVWGREWRDALDFNVESDPRVLDRAETLLLNQSVKKAAADAKLSPAEYLTALSRAEITQTAISHIVDVLLSQPEALKNARAALAAGGPSSLDTIINEALRLKPVYAAEVRKATADTKLPSGQKVNAGEAVIVLNAVANRDEAHFVNADKFAPSSTPALGLGISGTDAMSRLAAAEVRAGVAALINKTGLRRADGDWGELDRRVLIEAANLVTNPLGDDEYRYTFPERFAVEWNIASPSSDIQIPSPLYAYEAYLNDYDRGEYRLCISSQMQKGYSKVDVIRGIFTGLKINKLNLVTMDSRDHFFCRLSPKFRSCILKKEKEVGFHHLAPSDKHKVGYQTCNKEAPLTSTEDAFYTAVMLGEPMRTTMLDTKQAKRTSGEAYLFEDYLKFYDRYRARSSLMNPAGQLKYKDNDRDILFYVRLNIDFRSCMGATVIKHDVGAKVGLDIGKSRPDQYEICKNGVWNQNSLRREGRLSKEEKYFYETIFLGRKVSYQDVK